MLTCSFLPLSNPISIAFANDTKDIIWNPVKYEDDIRKMTAKLPGEKMHVIYEGKCFNISYNNMIFVILVDIPKTGVKKTLEEFIKYMDDLADKVNVPRPKIEKFETKKQNVIYAAKIESGIKQPNNNLVINFITANAVYAFHVAYHGELSLEDRRIIDEAMNSIQIER